jgi:hypothetical protein
MWNSKVTLRSSFSVRWLSCYMKPLSLVRPTDRPTDRLRRQTSKATAITMTTHTALLCGTTVTVFVILERWFLLPTSITTLQDDSFNGLLSGHMVSTGMFLLLTGYKEPDEPYCVCIPHSKRFSCLQVGEQNSSTPSVGSSKHVYIFLYKILYWHALWWPEKGPKHVVYM